MAQGGSYTKDPKTGKLTLVHRTKTEAEAKAEVDAIAAKNTKDKGAK